MARLFLILHICVSLTACLPAGPKHHLERAGNYLSKNDLKMAGEEYQSAFELSKETGDLASQADSLFGLGYTAQKMGDPDLACQRYHNALTLAKRGNSWRTAYKSLYNLYLLNIAYGNYPTALQQICEAEEIAADRIGDKEKTAKAMTEKARILFLLGDYENALKSSIDSLRITEEIGNEKTSTINLISMANIYFNLGQYHKSVQRYEQAIAWAKDFQDYKLEADGNTGLGLVFIDLLRLEDAERYLRKALSIHRECQDWKGQAIDMNNLGLLSRLKGEIEGARDYFLKAQEIFEDLAGNREIGICLGNLGMIFLEEEEYEHATKSLKEAMEIFLDLGNKKETAVTYSRLGRIFFIKGEYDLAEESYFKGMRLAREIDRRETLWRIYFGLGQIYERCGRDDEALSYYENAVAVIEAVRRELVGEEIREGYLGDKEEVYESLISLLIRTEGKDSAESNLDRALQYAWRLDLLKRRELFDRLDIQFENKQRDTLYRQERGVASELNGVHHALERAQEYDKRDKSSDAFVYLKKRRARTRQEYKAFIDALAQKDPYFYSMINIKPIELGHLQYVLDENTCLIEYYLAAKQLIIFMITRNQLAVETVRVDRSEVEGAVDRFLEVIKNRGFDSEADIEEYKKIANQLYSWLFKPVEGKLKSKAILGIVPNSSLHYLPFQALLIPSEEGETRFLIEKFLVFYLNSNSMIAFAGGRTGSPESPKNFLGLANPDGSLLHAESEVISLKDLYTSSDFYLKDDASEQRVKLDSGNYKYVHIASHGVFDSSSPNNSYILLAPEGMEDGKLTVEEIYGIDYHNNHLITLSACDTAVGRLALGDEVVNLSGAFLFAGVPTVVASLWRIDDEVTRILMVEFYRNMKTMPKAEALRHAQLKVISMGRTSSHTIQERRLALAAPPTESSSPADYAHPYFWAPYILVGNWK